MTVDLVFGHAESDLANAVRALAHEQHTANLIALANTGRVGMVDKDTILDEAFERLGISWKTNA